MDKANIAKGYDMFTGDVDETHMANKRYGEIHTGDDWLPARDRFCTRNDETHNDMPVGLIIFGDKSHTIAHYLHSNILQLDITKQHTFLETTSLYSQSWLWLE
jgi:hypothetical protein